MANQILQITAGTLKNQGGHAGHNEAEADEGVRRVAESWFKEHLNSTLGKGERRTLYINEGSYLPYYFVS
jgi:hypothetical protein